MGFGSLAMTTGDEHHQMFSPRTSAQKRSAQLGNSSDISPATPQKVARKALQRQQSDDSTSASTSVGSRSPSSKSIDSPLVSSTASDSDQQKPTKLNLPEAPSSDSNLEKKHGGLDATVGKAIRLFTDAYAAFAITRDCGRGTSCQRYAKADEFVELWTAEKGRYEALKDALCELLLFVGPLRPDGNYEVIEFEGCPPPCKMQQETKDLSDSDRLQQRLEWFRCEPRARAFEACCAVMAALSSRKEKSWLEAHDIEGNLESDLASMPGCASKASAARKQALRKMLEDEWCPAGYGFFAHYLVEPSMTFRIAFAPGLPRPTPAAVVITKRLPLFEALQALDDKGPLRGKAATREWCMAAGRQFAFQTANFGVPEASRKCRKDALSLQPEPKIRDLLRSRRPVVLLEVVAALAPRDIMKKEGFSEIVKAELARVMRDAKAQGEAVVFCLGSASPHNLAEKVYLRAPIGDYGLQCGYLRWRDSSEYAWGRERSWRNRICLCLQMP